LTADPLFFALPFPAIDPVAVAIGPIQIRWYALAYVVGIVLGWRYGLWLSRRRPDLVAKEALDDFVTWAVLGVIFGGRLGYVLFYKPLHYVENPLEILMVWQGGMSFHGGAAGVLIAIFAYSWRSRISGLALGDVVAAATPIGLGLGRIANFVNGELFGRPADVPWAVVFPGGGPRPRHPSQLYEAVLEGAVLFLILWLVARNDRWRSRPGFVGGVFLAGYALARIVGELFREPDAHLGFLAFGTTMGQWLSLPMLAVGIVLMLRAKPAEARSA
jgi:phosphatidylglycerol:prolipoprotein diacylglycerol transferase